MPKHRLRQSFHKKSTLWKKKKNQSISLSFSGQRSRNRSTLFYLPGFRLLLLSPTPFKREGGGGLMQSKALCYNNTHLSLKFFARVFVKGFSDLNKTHTHTPNWSLLCLFLRQKTRPQRLAGAKVFLCVINELFAFEMLSQNWWEGWMKKIIIICGCRWCCKVTKGVVARRLKVNFHNLDNTHLCVWRNRKEADYCEKYCFFDTMIQNSSNDCKFFNFGFIYVCSISMY